MKKKLVILGAIALSISSVPTSASASTNFPQNQTSDELFSVVTETTIIGDVNDDGKFTVADAVTLQKWLLNVPDVKLANWKAADLCEDGVLDVFDLCMMRRELIKQIPPTSNSYSFNSYNELSDKIKESNYFIDEDLNTNEDLFYKTISAFSNNTLNLYVPTVNGDTYSLRNKKNSPNITLMTSELYNLPWIWYHCSYNDSDIDVKLAYPSAIENNKIESTNTYYEVLQMIAPDSPNPENYTEFESYKKIYETEISLENGTTVVAMISELKDSNKVYVMFTYKGMLVSVYADETILSKSFWNEFSLMNYEQIDEANSLNIQIPPASNTYLFNSYNELADAIIKSDSFANEEFSDYGEIFYKTISAFEKKEINLSVPVANEEIIPLRNKENSSNIALITSELYNLPWIWYRCTVNDIDIDIKLAYPSVIESDKLSSAKTYYEILKMIAPNAPNPDNHSDFESYQYIYETEIQLANDKNVTAMISEIKDNTKIYVMFLYDDIMVSVYTDKNNMSEEFWNSFSLTKQ